MGLERWCRGRGCEERPTYWSSESLSTSGTPESGRLTIVSSGFILRALEYLITSQAPPPDSDDPG